MQDSFLTQILLPLVLAVVMFGMGLSLTRDDFARLWRVPKPILVGLLGQVLLLPFLAWLVANAFQLSSELAIGLMILAACPGGTMSNVISHLVRANLALSVSLTAVTTVICVFTTPWIIQFGISYFGTEEAREFSLLQTSIGLIFLTLLPVLIGIIVREKFPAKAIAWELIFRRFTLAFMVLMILAIVYEEREMLANSFGQVFWATLVLNLTAIFMGMILGKVSGVAIREQLTLGIEVGIQNASMAILIAVTFLSEPALATSAGIYGLTMYIGAGLLTLLARRNRLHIKTEVS